MCGKIPVVHTSDLIHKWRTLVLFEQQGAVVEQTPWDGLSIQQALIRHSPGHVFPAWNDEHKNKSEAQRGKRASYELVDRDLSLLLLGASEALKSKPQFLFLSSMGVVEGTTNRYLRARADVEQAIKNSELSWLIAQPAFISGSDRDEFRPLERFGSVVSDGLLKGLSALGGGALYRKYASLTSNAGCRVDFMGSGERAISISECQDLKRATDQSKQVLGWEHNEQSRSSR